MTQLTYEDIQQRGKAVIDAALPLREKAETLEKQVDVSHPASSLTRDAQMKAHWAIRDAQDAKHLASTKMLLTAETRLGCAKVTLDKAKEAIDAGDAPHVFFLQDIRRALLEERRLRDILSQDYEIWSNDRIARNSLSGRQILRRIKIEDEFRHIGHRINGMGEQLDKMRLRGQWPWPVTPAD